jgi:hypothetical protein
VHGRRGVRAGDGGRVDHRQGPGRSFWAVRRSSKPRRRNRIGGRAGRRRRAHPGLGRRRSPGQDDRHALAIAADRRQSQSSEALRMDIATPVRRDLRPTRSMASSAPTSSRTTSGSHHARRGRQRVRRVQSVME